MKKFRASFVEETVIDGDAGVIGRIRIKPSSVMWKPKGRGKFHSVSLDKFARWITDPDTEAKKVMK